ncbi:MAG: iron ABC transporter permease [Clostridia bacterium]|nr:iron ABC transporter permease [Clostridia bacterium]
MKRLQNKPDRIRLLYAAASVFVLASALLGILLGSTDLSFTKILGLIFEADKSSPEYRIFWYVRFPRPLAALFCGAALAVSGAVIQKVLANRLASPSIIGVNAGAGLAVTICAACGILGGWRLSLFSFLGAFLTVLLVSVGAKRWGASRGTVVLIGVALNSLLGAISDTVITLDPNAGIFRNEFKIGDFSYFSFSALPPAFLVIALALILLFVFSNRLDVLSLGDEEARALGMNTSAMRVLFLLLAALLAGAAVSIAGLLSFVGLLVPHAIRRLGATESRHQLPLCALFGGGFVALCDTLSRVLFSPYEIPVGIIMAFLGAPFFLYLLLFGKGDQPHA